MTKDKLAKALLTGKTCDKCYNFGDDYPSPLYCAIDKKPLPKEYTCEEWKSTDWMEETAKAHALILQRYEKLLAQREEILRQNMMEDQVLDD